MAQKSVSILGAFVAETARAINDNFAELYAGAGVVLTADPASPADDTWWVRRTGTSPAMDVEVRVRIAGVTYSLPGITI